MILTTLITTTLIISSAAANTFSSGMFLVRISSEQPHNIRYCFTELPYSVRRRQNNRCLKSGDIEVAKRTEKVIDLSLINITTAYITVEFIIQSGEQGPSRYISERVVVDGALPAKRIAIASGLVMDFVTICDRPWYGMMCSRYCTEHNGVHYVCDPRGEKVCLAGWTGKDCETATKDVFLVPFDETTLGPPTTTFETATTSTYTGRLTTGTLGIKTVEIVGTTTAASVTSVVVTSARKKSRVHKGSKTPASIISKIYTVQNTRTTLPPLTSTITISSFANPAFTSEDKNSYTSSPVKQDSESNAHGIILTLLFLLIALAVTGYLLTICARNTSMQNWINSRRAKISGVTCAAAVQIQRCNAEEPVQKIFAIDVEKAMTNVAYETSEDLGPRYSAQPTMSADQSPSKSDVSTVESNVYHEIDSFLVSPSLVEQRVATLV